MEWAIQDETTKREQEDKMTKWDQTMKELQSKQQGPTVQEHKDYRAVLFF